jgi:outer membrane protein
MNYSDNKSISLILNKKNLVVGKMELDITDEIIKIINKEIKQFKIQ